MFRPLFKFYLLFIVLFLGTSLKGQDLVTSNAWNAIFTTQTLTASSSIQLELHKRTQEFYDAPDQILVRPNFGYRVNPNVQLRIGVTYIKNAPQTIENNLWEQIAFRYPTNWGAYGGWLRIEHRNIEKNNRITVNHRFRYRLFLQKPLTPSDAKIPVSIFGYGEIFWKLQQRTLASDQLWKFVGLTFRIAPKMQLRSGFQQTTVFQTFYNKRVKNIWNTILFINL